jgi:hypothetical protein
MSSQLPPKEDLPIFDNSVFTRGSEALTYDVAITEFLAYPSAQGTEQLLNTSVIGDLTVANVIFPSGEKQLNSATATFNETTSSSTVSYTNTKYLNSTINFTSNQNTTITIPIPVIGSYLKIFNNCQYYATLNIDGTKTFTGEWGNSDPTIRLNPNTWSLLYATATTGWNIIDRSANQIFDTLSITTATSYEPHYNLLNAYVPFSPDASTGRNVTIPLATATFSRNKYIKISNANTSNPLTIVTTGNSFLGKYGSGTTSLIIPINTWVELFSDGTNWLVNDRSINFNNTAITTVSATPTDLTTRYDFGDAYLYLSPTQIYTVNIPNPTTAQTGKIYTIENTHNYFYTTLSISSGVFTGAYGSEATTFILPENSWLQMYSNGTNWVVNNVSNQGFSYYKTITTSTYTLEAQYFNSYTFAIQANITVTLPTINPKSVNLPITVQLVAPIAGSANIAFSPNCTLVGSTYNVVSYISNYITRGGLSLGTRSLMTFDNAYFTATTQKSTITFKPVKVSSTGSNTTGLTITCTSGKRTATITTNSTNTINIGTIISADGNNYTITGIGTCTGGTCTGTTGSTSLTLNTVTGNITILTPGQSIIISGNEYLITQLTGVGASGATATLSTALSTSPSATAFTPISGTGLLSSSGTYTLNRPALTELSGSAYTVVQDSYAWVTI